MCFYKWKKESRITNPKAYYPEDRSANVVITLALCVVTGLKRHIGRTDRDFISQADEEASHLVDPQQHPRGNRGRVFR